MIAGSQLIEPEREDLLRRKRGEGCGCHVFSLIFSDISSIALAGAWADAQRLKFEKPVKN